MTRDADHADWDLSSCFQSFDGPECRARIERLGGNLAKLEEQARNLGALSEENTVEWIEIFLRNENIVIEYSHLNS